MYDLIILIGLRNAIVRTRPLYKGGGGGGGGIDLLKFGNKDEDKIFFLEREGLN